MNYSSDQNKNRREFLFDILKTSARITTSSVVVYSVGLINKNLHGSIVAGAKTGSWVMTGGPYISNEACVDLGTGIGLIHNPPTGPCTVGATDHSFNTNKSLPNGGFCRITEADYECQ